MAVGLTEKLPPQGAKGGGESSLVLRTAVLIKVSLEREGSWAVTAPHLKASGKRRVTETPGGTVLYPFFLPRSLAQKYSLIIKSSVKSSFKVFLKR